MKWSRLVVVLFWLGALGATTTASCAEKIVVGFVQDTLANDWRLNQVLELQNTLKRIPNVQFIYADAKGSAARQLLETEKMISGGVDILVASPRDSEIMTPVLERAYRSGIPVVLLTRLIHSPDYTSFIAPDDLEIAKSSAEFIAERLNGSGRVLMIQGVTTSTTAKKRTSGFFKQLEKYPNIRVVAKLEGNYTRQDSILAMERLLESGVKFDAIYAQSDSMAEGARVVMKKRGLNPADFIIVGIDYIQSAREAIRKGEQTASFTYPTCASEAGGVIERIIANKKVRKRITVASQLVTKSNVEAVKPIF